MSKISLVTRRQDKQFAPTAALQRAQYRALESRPGSPPVRDSAPESRATFIPLGHQTSRSTTEAPPFGPQNHPPSPSQTEPVNHNSVNQAQDEINFSMQQNNRLRDELELLLGDQNEAMAQTRIVRKQQDNACTIQINIIPHEESKMLSAREVSDILGVTPGTVIRLCKRGKLKGYKIGHNWRFSWHEVMTSLNSTFSPTLN